ncbi:multicopper oxidase domain-containing protein, partial [Nocardioides sp.]|uniref:multicopper oxidase domain-containing protein n=1 Tax=Nocardioides sp. TaxID=35761 RepID=UPI00286E32E2
MTNPRSESLALRQLAGDLVIATLLAVTGTVWLSWLMSDHDLTTSQLLIDSAAMLAITLPLVMVAVVVPLNLAREQLSQQPVIPVSLLATAPAAALAISAAHQAHLVFLSAYSTTVSLVDLMGDAASLLVVVVPVMVALLTLRHLDPAPLLRRWPVVLAVVVGLNTAALTATLAPGASGSTPGNTSCLAGGPVDKSFDVTSLNVDIPVNRFGDHDPLGKMYALTGRIADVRAQEASQVVSIGLRDDAIQPLVIRANQGECIEIAYTNSATGGDFGLHIDGLEFGVSSSGDSVGANPTSAVPPGSTTTYRFSIPDDRRLEGAHYIHPGPGYRAAVDHGLFGSLVVEPPGSTYWNASTPGQPLLSGWEAIIKPLGIDVPCDPASTPASCAFRETALLNHEIGNDNEQLTAKNGLPVPLVDDITGSYRPGSFALNYRSEPFRNRLLAFP